VRVRGRDRTLSTALEEQVELGGVGELHRQMERAVGGVHLVRTVRPVREKRLAIEAAHQGCAEERDVEALGDVEIVNRQGEPLCSVTTGRSLRVRPGSRRSFPPRSSGAPAVDSCTGAVRSWVFSHGGIKAILET
jgi:hypothetical protein